MTHAPPRLVVHGAGRMGRLVAQLAPELGFDLVGVVDQCLPDANDGVACFPDFEAVPETPDVVIDFTLPDGAVSSARWCAANGVPLVSGTTGLDETQRAALVEASRQVPVLCAANFSPGINLLLSLLQRAAPLLDDSASLSMTDVHHEHKKDAPSGTALALARMLDPHNVPIESRREGEVVGDHAIHIQMPGERLELAHHAEDRSVFARGALQSARWVIGKAPGFYGAADSLGATVS